MRLIDADALKKDWSMANKCEECPQDARKCQYEQDFSRMDICEMLDEAPTVGGWISVKDRLPENAKHPGAFCPSYLVYTDYGITEGWYNPDKGCWYGILKFLTDVYEEWNIDLVKGDIPKTVKNIPVKYWMPMPKAPKGGETE